MSNKFLKISMVKRKFLMHLERLKKKKNSLILFLISINEATIYFSLIICKTFWFCFKMYSKSEPAHLSSYISHCTRPYLPFVGPQIYKASPHLYGSVPYVLNAIMMDLCMTKIILSTNVISSERLSLDHASKPVVTLYPLTLFFR